MAPRRPNPVERDRSTPTIVTRTSSVRAVVGDDGGDNNTGWSYGDKSDK